MDISEIIAIVLFALLVGFPLYAYRRRNYCKNCGKDSLKHVSGDIWSSVWRCELCGREVTRIAVRPHKGHGPGR